MTIKKNDEFDIAFKQLESVRNNPIISKKDSCEILNDINNVLKHYPNYDLNGPIDGLKNVTLNSEKFIPIINLQIYKNKLLENEYIKLDKLIDIKKKFMVDQLKNIKKDIIEGIDIGKAIRNSPVYKEAKRIYNKAVQKLNEIKKKN